MNTQGYEPSQVFEQTAGYRSDIDDEYQRPHQALYTLFRRAMDDSGVLPNDEVTKIIGRNWKTRRSVLTRLEVDDGVFFYRATSGPHKGDWVLPSAEKQVSQAKRIIHRSFNDLDRAARMLDKAEPHLSKSDRTEARGIKAVAQASTRLLSPGSIDAVVAETGSAPHEVSNLLERIVGRRSFR
ncbi:hypothetical protein J4G37_24995 [Microvirga sp. 3-52]|nr:hypothetical protein [Microvirga sp. 3-52]